MPLFPYLLTALMLLPTFVQAEPDSVRAEPDSTSLTLTGISGNVIGDTTLIILELNNAPPWQEVAVHSRGNLLELQLPDVVTNTAEQLHTVNSPYVLKLMPLQLNAHTASLRVFSSTEGSLLQQATTVEVAGKQIIVFVDHNKIEAAVGASRATPATTPVVDNLLTTQMQLAAGALIALCMLLLCIFGLRRLFTASRRSRQLVPSPILCSVGELALSPRQSLALVEVYGQRMLFAVSNNRIELLSSTVYPPSVEKQPGVQLPVQLDSDIYLNQRDLAAQKSMQRGQHYRETLTSSRSADDGDVAAHTRSSATGVEISPRVTTNRIDDVI